MYPLFFKYEYDTTITLLIDIKNYVLNFLLKNDDFGIIAKKANRI